MKPFTKDQYSAAAKMMRGLPELDACRVSKDADWFYVSDLLENAITMMDWMDDQEDQARERDTLT